MSEEAKIQEIRDAAREVLHGEATEFLRGLSDGDLQEVVQSIDRFATASDAMEALGKSLGSGATGKSAIHEAKMQLARLRTKIRSAICGSPTIKSAVKRPALASIYLITALVLHELIKSNVGGGVNVVLIAVVAVRGGLEDLCREEWA